jgi:hypothetical protein
MPRKPSDKPWKHGKSGFWCATIDGKRQYLDREYNTARRKLKAIRDAQARGERISGDWLDASFAELADEYLEDVKARKKPATYTAMQYRLTRALKVLGTGLRVCDLRKMHLARIERDMLPNYSPTTVKDTIAAVQSIYHWAVRMDILDVNPLIGYEKPKARQRTRTFVHNSISVITHFPHDSEHCVTCIENSTNASLAQNQ